MPITAALSILPLTAGLHLSGNFHTFVTPSRRITCPAFSVADEVTVEYPAGSVRLAQHSADIAEVSEDIDPRRTELSNVLPRSAPATEHDNADGFGRALAAVEGTHIALLKAEGEADIARRAAVAHAFAQMTPTEAAVTAAPAACADMKPAGTATLAVASDPTHIALLKAEGEAAIARRAAVAHAFAQMTPTEAAVTAAPAACADMKPAGTATLAVASDPTHIALLKAEGEAAIARRAAVAHAFACIQVAQSENEAPPDSASAPVKEVEAYKTMEKAQPAAAAAGAQPVSVVAAADSIEQTMTGLASTVVPRVERWSQKLVYHARLVATMARLAFEDVNAEAHSRVTHPNCTSKAAPMVQKGAAVKLAVDSALASAKRGVQEKIEGGLPSVRKTIEGTVAEVRQMEIAQLQSLLTWLPVQPKPPADAPAEASQTAAGVPPWESEAAQTARVSAPQEMEIEVEIAMGCERSAAKARPAATTATPLVTSDATRIALLKAEGKAAIARRAQVAHAFAQMAPTGAAMMAAPAACADAKPVITAPAGAFDASFVGVVPPSFSSSPARTLQRDLPVVESLATAVRPQ